MSQLKRIKAFVCCLLFSFSLLACDTINADDKVKTASQKKLKKSKKEKIVKTEVASTEINIIENWELPAILKEVSGIAYLGNNSFACVQDEAGIIFIYNTRTARIEKQITFGASGDYEGIAVVGKTAYIVRSDGKIFEVNNLDSQPSRINQYATPLTAKNNIEGLTYDSKNNRLLIAIKGVEDENKNYKGIYAFDLKKKKLSPEPVIKLNLTDPGLPENKGKNLNKAWQPSEIAVHPTTGAIYITEATNPQLFILDSKGAIQTRYKLSDKDFPQPEGLSFSPTGELFISNEGQKANGNILQVKIIKP